VASPVQDWLSGIERLGHALPSTWIGLTNWNEVSGWTAPEEVRASLVEAPRFRRAVISALSRVDRGRWVKVQEVEELCRDLVSGSDASPHGDHAILRAHSRFERDHSRWTTAILGAAWILGLVRMGELSRGGHAIVQATERSRKLYDASEPEVTESPGLPCLWIQPNFEIIAYRQGLVPSLIGTLGVWSRLDRIGTAVQLRLDADSIARGLQGGGDVEGFLESLERGATRGVPPAVAEAVRSWARQRQRVSVYPEATLMEFATDEERATAVAAWPESDRCTVMLVGERYLLVESETGVPFGRFRLLGSRDYRQPAEANAVVGEDGLTLSIDLDRSDLFIEAELARLADREPMISAESARRRKFRVTRESVKRAIESGWGVAEWTEWFERRTGQALPPAARLLVEAGQANVVCFRVSRRFVLTASEANWLDGLAQHAAQSGLELERVGPRSMLVAEDDLSRLRALIQSLGVDVSIE
jgi:hypothetical protein